MTKSKRLSAELVCDESGKPISLRVYRDSECVSVPVTWRERDELKALFATRTAQSDVEAFED